MPIPTALALAAALGSLVTSTKSGWELSRMVRQKHDRIQAEKDSVQVYRSLRKALHSGRMSEKEYDQWYEKFLVAESEKNLSGLRKIRAHLRIINDNAYHEKRPRHHSSRKTEDSRGRVRNEKEDGRYRDDSRGRSRGKKDSGRYYDDNKRRQSVRFDSPPQTYYVPDPPLREQDIEWPQSAGSIEYFPLKEQFPTHEKDEDPEVVQLARLQRSASVSYSQPRDRPSSTHAGRSEWTAQRERERGRSRRREARESSSQPGSDSSSSEDHEKLGYRSRR